MFVFDSAFLPNVLLPIIIAFTYCVFSLIIGFCNTG